MAASATKVFTVGQKVVVRAGEGVWTVTDVLPNNGGVYRLVQTVRQGSMDSDIVRWDHWSDVDAWEETDPDVVTRYLQGER